MSFSVLWQPDMSDTTTQLENRECTGLNGHPDLAKFIDYCSQLAGDGRLPHRDDFRASQVRWMFGHLYLVDVMEQGADYRCRLWGQFWETIFGINMRERCLSDLEQGGHVLHLRFEYAAILADGKARFRAGRVVWPDDRSMGFARVIVPFTGNGGNISMLACGGTSEMSPADLVFFKGLGIPSFSYDGPAQVIESKPG